LLIPQLIFAGIVIYGIYDLATSAYDWYKDMKYKIDHPKPFSDPQYHKQITDATEKTREFGKEATWDVMTAGLPENKAVELGGVICDVAK